MEAPLALYRRYRPETFAEVIGQDHVTAPLRNALSNNRVNHAYLFSGPRGCGKTTSARILARAINCEKGPIAEPCGVCKSCTDLARGGPGSIDVIEIDAASHGGVDDARDLRERAFFAPVESRYKIYIIDEAHMVTTQGFNALLKLVEEPPPHLKFIFATTEPDKVIGTIRSRTHHYPFRLVPPKVLGDYMAKLCESEGVAIESAALPLVVRAGAGSVRDSLSVLDQLIGGAGPEGVTYELAVALLGFTPDSLLDSCVDGFAAHDSAAVFETVEKVIETGQDPKRFAEDLLRRLRDLVVLSAVPNAVASGLIEAAEDQGERLQTQAAGIGPAELTRAADIVAAGLLEMRGATAPRLQLELICAKVLLPGADDSTNGIQARLDRMERRLTIGGPIEGAGVGGAAGAGAVGGTAGSAGRAGGTAGAGGMAASTAGAGGAAAGGTADAGQSGGSADGADASSSPSSSRAAARAAATAGGAVGGTAGAAAGAGSAASGGSAEAGLTTAASAAGSAGVGADGDASGSGASPGGALAGGAPAGGPSVGGVSAAGGARTGGWGDEPVGAASGQVTAAAQAAPVAAPVAAVAGASGAPGGGAVGLADIRRLWPEVLDAVKSKRRFAWIMLSQNAQVIAIDDQTLTLGLVNAGARESFARSGSDEILRQAMIDTIGVNRKVEAVVDPSADPGAGGTPAGRPGPGPQPGGSQAGGGPAGGSAGGFHGGAPAGGAQGGGSAGGAQGGGSADGATSGAAGGPASGGVGGPASGGVGGPAGAAGGGPGGQGGAGTDASGVAGVSSGAGDAGSGSSGSGGASGGVGPAGGLAAAGVAGPSGGGPAVSAPGVGGAGAGDPAIAGPESGGLGSGAPGAGGPGSDGLGSGGPGSGGSGGPGSGGAGSGGPRSGGSGAGGPRSGSESTGPGAGGRGGGAARPGAVAARGGVALEEPPDSEYDVPPDVDPWESGAQPVPQGGPQAGQAAGQAAGAAGQAAGGRREQAGSGQRDQAGSSRREQAGSKRRAAEAAVAAEQARRASEAKAAEVALTPEEEADSIGEDDIVLEEDSRSHTDLLIETLGAQIITEEPN